jgi:hypothetical protein
MVAVPSILSDIQQEGSEEEQRNATAQPFSIVGGESGEEAGGEVGDSAGDDETGDDTDLIDEPTTLYGEAEGIEDLFAEVPAGEGVLEPGLAGEGETASPQAEAVEQPPRPLQRPTPRQPPPPSPASSKRRRTNTARR